MFAISRTPAFRNFQRSVGNSTFYLNTTVVGLELVARGGTRPSTLTIKWQPPKHPGDVAQQAKQFLVLSTLVHLIDSFDVLLREYAELDWLDLGCSLQEVLLKQNAKLTVAKRAEKLHAHFRTEKAALGRLLKQDGEAAKLHAIVAKFSADLIDGGFVDCEETQNESLSISDRTRELATYLGTEEDDAIAFVELSVAWRNVLVHYGRAKARLSSSAEQRLRAGSDRFHDAYAGIEIAEMLDHFSGVKRPTLKESTTMCAVIQNLARSLDKRVIEVVAGTPDSMKSIALHELRKSILADSVQWKSAWRRDAEARERFLIHRLALAGITDGTKAVSASLDPKFLSEMARLTLAEVEKCAPSTSSSA